MVGLDIILSYEDPDVNVGYTSESRELENNTNQRYFNLNFGNTKDKRIIGYVRYNVGESLSEKAISTVITHVLCWLKRFVEEINPTDSAWKKQGILSSNYFGVLKQNYNLEQTVGSCKFEDQTGLFKTLGIKTPVSITDPEFQKFSQHYRDQNLDIVYQYFQRQFFGVMRFDVSTIL